MKSFVLLAAAESHGFGLNLDILEANLINLAIIIAVLVYFGRGVLGKTLSERRAKIEEAITEAETRKSQASSALADQQQKLAQAKQEATRIRSEAEVRAKSAREAILVQAQEDVQRMKASAAQDLNSQQEKVIAELRQRVAAMAIAKVESQLRSGLGDDTQQQLIDRSIATIGGSR
jgi:F-type H+-transporting ATPase subunit b